MATALSSTRDLVFSVTDQNGRVSLCRALACFMWGDKLFVLYVLDGETPGVAPIRAGFCELSELWRGKIRLLPVKDPEHWRLINEAISAFESDPELYFGDNGLSDNVEEEFKGYLS